MPRWFRSTPSEPDAFRLAYEQGLAVGAMQAEIAALKAEIAAIAHRLPTQDVGLTLAPEITLAMQRLSRGDAALYRFMDTQARELVEAGMPTVQIVEQLKMGTPSLRLDREA